MLSAIRSIPVRVQLTVVLVLLVIALASSLTYITYRVTSRSLEEYAVASLETATRVRSEAIESVVVRKQERLASVAKSLELACDTGTLNVVCAGDILRPFVRKEHARGARLSWGRKNSMIVGEFVENPARRGPFFISSDPKDDVLISVLYKDEESELKLELQSTTAQLREAALSDPAHTVDVFVRVNETIESLSRNGPGDQPSSALASCFNGVDRWTLERDGTVPTYRYYRYLPRLQACVVSAIPQASVFAPLERLRGKLARTVAGFILGAAVLAYVLGYLLAHPLRLLRRRVKALKQGDYESPVPVAGTGEIRELSEAVASMTKSLAESRSALAQSEKKLMLAYKAAGLWIWEYQPSVRRLTWRDPADATGQARSQSIRSAFRQIDARDRHAVVSAIRSAGETGFIEVEFRYKTQGAERWISASGQVLYGDNGKPSLIAGISLDSTSRKQAQHLEAERATLIATADMAASLAHEINNPLSSVIGAIYMASSTPVEALDLRKYLEIARQEADRVAHIARQMLSLYRKPTDPEPVNLRHILQNVIDTCRPHAQRKQQVLEADLRQCGAVLGYPDELQQAFMNVLTNAIEHSPNHGSVTIRAYRCHSPRRPAERGVRVIVANTRAYTLPQPTNTLFAPFVGSKTERGHGLGLWVARSVVIRHGGTVRLRSFGAQGASACCAIYLPNRCTTTSV